MSSSELFAHRCAAGSHAPSAGEFILGLLRSWQAPISPRPGPRVSARGLQVPARATPPLDRSLRLCPLHAQRHLPRPLPSAAPSAAPLRGLPRTTALPAPRRAAQQPNSRPLSHSGVNERPLTPMLTPGPQTPSPVNSWPGRDPGRRRQSRRSPGSPRFSALLRDKTAGHGLHAPSGLADPPPALGDAPGRRPEKGVLSL